MEKSSPKVEPKQTNVKEVLNSMIVIFVILLANELFLHFVAVDVLKVTILVLVLVLWNRIMLTYELFRQALDFMECLNSMRKNIEQYIALLDSLKRSRERRT